MSAPDVYRDKIKDGRADYFVTYQPADCRFPFAVLDLVFLTSRLDCASVAHAMEQELDTWLKRYPVPVMVSAFDVKEELISVHGDSGKSHLTGYRDLSTDRIVRRWGLLKDSELPAGQVKADYLQNVYSDVPFRDQAAVREAARRESKNMVRAARAIIFFIVVVPVLIEISSLGVAWVGYLLMAISIATGAYKAAKAFGWVKPTERDKAKAEEELKMRHYYWHCERNPEAFNRLKIENFERELIEETRKEAAALGVNTTSRERPVDSGASD